MANPTMTLIGSPITVGSGGASSVTFSSIPNTYTDLVVKASIRTTSSSQGTALYYRYNGDSGSNYSFLYLNGNGSSPASGSNGTTSVNYPGIVDTNGDTSNTFASLDIYIPNYASSNYKSSSADNVSENNGTTAYATLSANLWKNTTAITSITLLPSSDNLAQYSTFYLYGISNS